VPVSERTQFFAVRPVGSSSFHTSGSSKAGRPDAPYSNECESRPARPTRLTRTDVTETQKLFHTPNGKAACMPTPRAYVLRRRSHVLVWVPGQWPQATVTFNGSKIRSVSVVCQRPRQKSSCGVAARCKCEMTRCSVMQCAAATSRSHSVITKSLARWVGHALLYRICRGSGLTEGLSARLLRVIVAPRHPLPVRAGSRGSRNVQWTRACARVPGSGSQPAWSRRHMLQVRAPWPTAVVVRPGRLHAGTRAGEVARAV
jgi:hypothetical protein